MDSAISRDYPRGMLKIILSYIAPQLGPHRVPPATPDWARDPLSHPDLRRMSQRELADLPFDANALERE